MNMRLLKRGLAGGWTPVCRAALVCLAVAAPASAQDVATSITLTTLNTTCSGGGDFTLVGDGTLDGGIDCICGPPLRTLTSTDPGLLAQIDACGALEVQMSGSSYVSWVRLEITRSLSGTETLCLYDYGGGSCDNTYLCGAGYTWLTNQTFASDPPDTDGDGDPNCTDPDDDNDGVLDVDDNCPTVANPAQTDSNGNGTGDACEPSAITVPWLGNPNQPHQVYSGGSLVLQGVAMNPTNGEPVALASATWDPGDGSGPQAVSVADPLALELTHTYTGSDGQPFTAILEAIDNDGNVLTDTMKVVVLTRTQDVEVNMAIDKGLWYLHKRTQRTNVSGGAAAYWTALSSQWNESATAGVVQAFGINGHRSDGNPVEDPYVINVRRGLNYLFDRLRVLPANAQQGNNPDGNANTISLGVGRTTGGDHESYIQGQVMDAIIAGGTPGAIATTGNATWVSGRSYAEIIQDMLDAYSWGATDPNACGSSGPNGAWNYNFFNNSGCRADSSASHWWAIGVLAAETWGLDAPAWLKSQNWNNAIPWWQNPTSCLCGYTSTGPIWDGGLNVTPACLIMMNADDIPQTNARFTCAESWLAGNFYAGVVGNFYSMYQLAKAMRTALDGAGDPAQIELLNGTIDWYDAFADHLVGVQAGNGSFNSSQGVPTGYLNGDTSTSWAIIMLSPTLFELGPVAACTSQPPIDGTLALGGEATFDGSGSSHLDPDYTGGLTYDWDFQDGDTASGVSATHSFVDVGIYDVELTVTDDNGLTDMTTCPIDVRAERIPPFANTGGRYQICLGDSLTLDGSGSRDLDTFITAWEWDWTAPVGDFSPADATGETVDATGVFSSLGVFDLGLRVTDNDEYSSEDGASPGPNQSSAFTTVTVIDPSDPSCNQPPVAVCEAQSVFADALCEGTASIDGGSYDPDDDPVNIVENPPPPYPLGDTEVTLVITDDSNESDSCSATVTVIDNTPPTATCPDPITLIAQAGCVEYIPELAVDAGDNCSVASVVQSPAAGTLVELLGEASVETVVTVTVTDGSGNPSACQTTVTVVDPDGDNVCGTDDVCADTVFPEGVPTRKHGTNRWALTEPGDGDPFTFDTVGPNGSNRAYTTTDTGGCSCEQIIATCGYGKGHTKFGCSNSVMDWWTGLFDQAGQEPYQCH